MSRSPLLERRVGSIRLSGRASPRVSDRLHMSGTGARREPRSCSAVSRNVCELCRQRHSAAGAACGHCQIDRVVHFGDGPGSVRTINKTGQETGGEAGIRTLGRALKTLQRFSKPPPSASRPPHRNFQVYVKLSGIAGRSSSRLPSRCLRSDSAGSLDWWLRSRRPTPACRSRP